MSDQFDERRKALEDQFFQKQNEKALAKVREAQAKEQEFHAFAAQHGITDAKLVAQLQAAGVHPQTLSALLLLPLAEVAWADGNLDAKERAAVQAAARQAGVAPGSEAEALLNTWLEHKPSPEMHDAWAAFAQQLVLKMGPEEKAKLRAQVIGPARKVAEASGGFLGVGAVNKAEKHVLENLDIWLS